MLGFFWGEGTRTRKKKTTLLAQKRRPTGNDSRADIFINNVRPSAVTAPQNKASIVLPLEMKGNDTSYVTFI